MKGIEHIRFIYFKGRPEPVVRIRAYPQQGKSKGEKEEINLWGSETHYFQMRETFLPETQAKNGKMLLTGEQDK